MKSKEELKKLFENGDKPTQENFWEWQDSYWHKDEKLPTENTGGYKIKGSLANLSALNALTDMQEGDVYNLLDSGDNYVYVLDLNNTGVTGWDKLSGIVNLSDINLHTVLKNGGYASNGNSIANFDLENRIFQTSISSGTGFENTQILQSSDNISITKTTMSGVSTPININQGGFLYGDDFSQRPEFGDRNLVDKAYVDNKIQTATLQTVLDNGASASNANSSYRFNLADENQNAFSQILQLSTDNEYKTVFSQTMENVEDPINGGAFIDMEVANPGTSFGVRLGKYALQYLGNYTANFGQNSLVDKAYVDNITQKTKGIIDNSSFSVNSGSMVGTINYEHSENSNYVTMRLNVLVTLNGAANDAVAVVTLPFEVGIVSQKVFAIQDGVVAQITSNNGVLYIRKTTDENISFNINQCLVFPYGFEAGVD